jgi:hypothetical protein
MATVEQLTYTEIGARTASAGPPRALVWRHHLLRLRGNDGKILRIGRRMVAAIALAGAVASCADDAFVNDLNPTRKLQTMMRPNWLTFSGHNDDLTLPPVREIDLISRAGQCAAVAPVGDTGGLLGGVSLQMTECEVVNRLGPPDNTDLDVDGRGERMVTLTYVGGARPGVYTFTEGRLSSIGRGPQVEPDVKRAPAKKSNRA